MHKKTCRRAIFAPGLRCRCREHQGRFHSNSRPPPKISPQVPTGRLASTHRSTRHGPSSIPTICRMGPRQHRRQPANPHIWWRCLPLDRVTWQPCDIPGRNRQESAFGASASPSRDSSCHLRAAISWHAAIKNRSRPRVDSESGSHSLVGLDGREKVNLSNGFRPNDLSQFYSKIRLGIQGKAVMRKTQQGLIPAIALTGPRVSKSGFRPCHKARQSGAIGN
jgi:hypothetical protein